MLEEQHASTTSHKESAKRRLNLVLPLIITFFLIVLVIIYTSRLFYRISVKNIHENAVDKVSSTAVDLENYIFTAKSVVWVTADSVNYMLANGASDSQIRRYLEFESENQKSQFDENYTGVYGYIRGLYHDGSGWVPPEDYEPTTRDWYLAAMEADGEVAIAKPYLDAQTGSIVISICKKLKDKQGSALSLDLIIDHIQTIVQETDVNGKGYCFVLDDDGTVIAHRIIEMNGMDIREMSYGDQLMQHMSKDAGGSFEMALDGQSSTLFTHRVMDQWTLVFAIGNRELYAEVYSTLIVNIITFLVVFVLIAAFYSIAYRNEERSNREAEALKIREQQQSYEAELLRVEKTAADAANAAKSNFLADMSHEIRTPINAVLGMNEMILRETTDPNIKTYAGNVESAGKNLLSIINDILDFSKIEAGKMEITDAPYKLSSVLNDVTNMITFRARSKDLSFDVHVDESIPDELYGDEVRVRQIVTNILTNAVKYTKEGGVTLDVKAKPRPDLMRREEDAADPNALKGFIDLIVSVTDTGIGIKEEDKEKLFQKFGRVDLQRTNTIEGTGLGLAITGNLLSLMHGDVKVDSTYGKGSTFTIRVPQGIISTDAIGDYHKKLEKSMQDRKAYHESFRAPDAHILVVDDTVMNLVVLKGLLKKTQAVLDTAPGGEEALKLAAEKAYDLILLDQRMPGLDGTETLQRLRDDTDGPNANTPVICLTADAVQGARERYLQEGFTDYLSKPVEGPVLEGALAQYLPADKIIRSEV